MTRGHSFPYGSVRPIARGGRAWLHGDMKFRKTYVDVVARIDADGRTTPLSILWRDGRTFEIERVHGAVRRASARVGGAGVRYLVSVFGREKYLFYEGPRWFVEEVVPEPSHVCVESGAGDSEGRLRKAARHAEDAPKAAIPGGAGASAELAPGVAPRAFEALVAALRRRSHPPMPRSHARRA